MRVGVSCATTDTYLIPLFNYLANTGKVHFVELYVKRETTVADLMKWKDHRFLNLRFHAPHDNRARFDPETIDFTNTVIRIFYDINEEREPIVFDAGLAIDINDIWHYPHAFPENMPAVTSLGEKAALIKPEDVKNHFIFDFAHATMSAHHLGKDPKVEIEKWLKHKPVYFHLSDTTSLYDDDHCALGRGLIDIPWCISKIPDYGTVTIETGHEVEDREAAIIEDLKVFWQLKK